MLLHFVQVVVLFEVVVPTRVCFGQVAAGVAPVVAHRLVVVPVPLVPLFAGNSYRWHGLQPVAEVTPRKRTMGRSANCLARLRQYRGYKICFQDSVELGILNH